MRFLPQSGHHILSAFFGQRCIGPRLHQERFDAGGEVAKNLGKGRFILTIPHSNQQACPVNFNFIRRHPCPPYIMHSRKR